MPRKKTPAPPPPPPPPPTPSSARQQTRLGRIAAAILAGKTVSEIAEEEGIYRSYCSKLANSDECRQYLAEFVNAELPEIHALFYRGLSILQLGLSARKEYVDKDGCIIRGGPDHYARIAVVKALAGLLMAARPKLERPPTGNQRSQVTLAELQGIIDRSKASR